MCRIGVKRQHTFGAVCSYARVFRKRLGRALIGACALIRTNTVFGISDLPISNQDIHSLLNHFPYFERQIPGGSHVCQEHYIAEVTLEPYTLPLGHCVPQHRYFYFFGLSFTSLSSFFTHIETNQSVGGAKTRVPREKPPDTPASRTWLVSHMNSCPMRGANPHR